MRRVHEVIERIAVTESAQVLRGEGIDVIEGRARFVGARSIEVSGRRIDASRFVVATGSSPFVPPIAGLPEVAYLTNETVWRLHNQPASMTIIGGGAVGCELAQAFARFGVRVAIVEAADRLLAKEEPQASAVVADVFKRDGIEVRLAAKAVRAAQHEGGTRVELDDGAILDAEQLLIAVGRIPSTAALDAGAAGIRLDGKGYVVTDARLRTSANGVYAVGDVTGKMPFTHAADEMGRIAAINALRAPLLRFHPEDTPWVTFTTPEVARVGMTEEQAAAHGGKVAFLPMTEVDRAITASATDGFVKLIAGPRMLSRNAGGGRLLGATIVAPRAGEMIHEIALAMRARAFTGRLAQTVHAYPTWSTAVRSAAALFFVDVNGRRATPAKREH